MQVGTKIVAPKVTQPSGIWDMLPQKIFKFRVSEILAFSPGHFQ